MNYWLDCFTGTTWREFRDSGARTTGFNERLRKNAGRIKPGDLFLCYLVRVMRWVGVLEVVGPSEDRSRIWKDADFPVRLEVRPLILLDPEHGVPMDALEGKVDFYDSPDVKGKFKGFVRLSPNLFKKPDDGRLIHRLLEEAKARPVTRPVDPKKLAYKPFFQAELRKGKAKVSLLVSVPDSDDRPDTAAAGQAEDAESGAARTRHSEIQYALLKVGAEMGLELWVARNDRNRNWNGRVLGDLPGMLDELPTQFNEATNRTIELIDVLWLRAYPTRPSPR